MAYGTHIRIFQWGAVLNSALMSLVLLERHRLCTDFVLNFIVINNEIDIENVLETNYYEDFEIYLL